MLRLAKNVSTKSKDSRYRGPSPSSTISSSRPYPPTCTDQCGVLASSTLGQPYHRACCAWLGGCLYRCGNEHDKAVPSFASSSANSLPLVSTCAFTQPNLTASGPSLAWFPPPPTSNPPPWPSPLALPFVRLISPPGNL